MNNFQTPTIRLIIGAALALLASTVAYSFKLLTRRGAFAAFLLGWVVFGFGGWNWALVLIAFFLSSSGVSLIFRKRKQQAEKIYAKGATRDAGQVLANGGVAGMFVLLHLVLPNSTIPWLGFCAALAAANADTWATELGILHRRNPVMIVSGKPVEPGTSGAVSLTGILAAGAGAALIALLAWFGKPAEISSWNPWWTGLILFAGIFGSLVDSCLGATLQAIYFCPVCQKETEKHPLHGCGAETMLLRGKHWMNNDWVNTFCTLSASQITVLLVLPGK